jgi:N-methylhydantoinase B/oxoprolinase/acetone carboxylase alpha subunit
MVVNNETKLVSAADVKRCSVKDLHAKVCAAEHVMNEIRAIIADNGCTWNQCMKTVSECQELIISKTKLVLNRAN